VADGETAEDTHGRQFPLEPASRRPVMKTYAPSCTNCFAVARPMPLLPPVMSAIFPSSLAMISPSLLALLRERPRVVRRRTAGYQEVCDDDLDGLVVLIERRRSHLDESLMVT
jgi:hypothetical protein